MKILIDTNVILDVLIKREPHYETSASILKLCGASMAGMITTSQTTDIYYLMRKEKLSHTETIDVLKKLTNNISVIDINSSDVKTAIACGMTDYEDALLAACGKRHKVQYVVTRNEKDFTQSQVPAVSPQEFIKKYFSV